MVTGKAWNEDELRIICRAYAHMLACQLRGEKYIKAQIRRAIVPQLDGRSEGSYEMKCCNISAALIDAGYVHWITGYKPLKGYQGALKQAAVLAVQIEGIDSTL